MVGVTVFFGWPKWNTPERPDWSYHPLNVINGGHLTDDGDIVTAPQTIHSPGTEVWAEDWSDDWPDERGYLVASPSHFIHTDGSGDPGGSTNDPVRYAMDERAGWAIDDGILSTQLGPDGVYGTDDDIGWLATGTIGVDWQDPVHAHARRTR
ncbi:MAG: hypothetical protein GF320_12920 [Armatimonadia bacterium]|nr:hypothetical protein [Armatimonadia bacterium]